MRRATDRSSITALVLAGGLGSRLHPIVGDLPKLLAPTAGCPFVHYVLDYLQSQGIVDIVLCTGYGAERVADYCKDGSRWGIRVRYSTELVPRGTGGAIKQSQSLIASNPFLVVNGDSLIRADLAQVIHVHAKKQAQITMVLTEVSHMARFGSVVLDGDSAIVQFSEKSHQGAGLISAGVYLMDRAVLETIPAGRPVSIEHEVFPRFVGKGLYGMVVPGPFIDIGTPEAYAMAQTVLLG